MVRIGASARGLQDPGPTGTIVGVKANRAARLPDLMPALLPSLLALMVTAAGCGVGETPFDDDDPTATPTGTSASAAQHPVPESGPPTSTGPIGAANVPFTESVDVTGSRASIEAGHAEVRAVLERELGVDGWRETREAQEVACPSRADASGQLDDGIGKFYAAELTYPEPLDADAWATVWDEIVRAVEPHGFRPKLPAAAAALDPSAAPSGSEGAHYAYLINEHRDELTVSTHPTIGTGFGGFGVCHPWGD